MRHPSKRLSKHRRNLGDHHDDEPLQLADLRVWPEDRLLTLRPAALTAAALDPPWPGADFNPPVTRRSPAADEVGKMAADGEGRPPTPATADPAASPACADLGFWAEDGKAAACPDNPPDACFSFSPADEKRQPEHTLDEGIPTPPAHARGVAVAKRGGLGYLNATLALATLAGMVVLGYWLVEIKTELARINNQLTLLNQQAAIQAPPPGGD